MTNAYRTIATVALFAACSQTRGSPGPEAARGAPARLAVAPLQSLLAVGESIYYRGAYDSARVLWVGALDRARTARDTAVEARLVTWLGLVAWRQGDYATARRLGEQALALKVRLNLTQDLFKSYNALGLLAWNEARLGDAVTLFDSAAAAARAAGDTKGLAAVSSNLALVNTELGEFAAARAGFSAARDGGHRLGDARIEGNALTNLAMLDIRSGDPLAAIAVLDEARQRYRTIGYATGEQTALSQLGTAYDALGEPRLAVAALDTALAAARAQGLRQNEASDLEALAQLHQNAGDVRGALNLYAGAQRINRDLDLDEETGADLRSEAEIHVTLGDLDLARGAVVEARAIHQRIGARVEEIGDLLLAADVLDRAGRRAESRASLTEARRLAASVGTRPLRVDVALAEARIADRASDAPGVLRALASARTRLSHGSYDTEWEIAALLCRAYTRLGRLTAAAAAGREAVTAVERVRSKFGSGLLRTDYLAGRATAYADFVTALARLGRWDDAFAVSDAARGRALVEHLAATERHPSGRPTAQSSARGEELLRRIDQLASQADSLEREVGPHGDSARRATVADLSRRLGEARSEYEAAAAEAADDRTPATALLGGTPVRASEVRASLSPTEVLLEYLVTADRVMIFVLTVDTVRMFTSPITVENLASRVRVARDFLANPQAGEDSGEAVLGSLYETLLGPARRAGILGDARPLIVVPHGVLSYLPFAALRDDRRRRYLIQDHVVSYLPAAAALPALRSTRVRVMALGGERVVAAVFAPDPEGLPATRREAMAVGRVVAGARLLVGPSATEASLRAALGTVPLVHVAGHGVMNASNPMFSRIQLAPGNGSPEDDGRLEVHELLDLSVTSTLVFLSGCETGVGTAWSSGFTRGEDYATLAQAFLFAGARSVVATLWRVEDDGAAAFAERFYRQLLTAPPAVALAAAQREMLADPRYRAPYHWAAYSLSGVGDRASDARESRTVSVRSITGDFPVGLAWEAP
jgi:CHAT domain-containing protein/tetratricopeptide (TPR) repeat protein